MYILFVVHVIPLISDTTMAWILFYVGVSINKNYFVMQDNAQ